MYNILHSFLSSSPILWFLDIQTERSLKNFSSEIFSSFLSLIVSPSITILCIFLSSDLPLLLLKVQAFLNHPDIQPHMARPIPQYEPVFPPCLWNSWSENHQGVSYSLSCSLLFPFLALTLNLPWPLSYQRSALKRQYLFSSHILCTREPRERDILLTFHCCLGTILLPFSLEKPGSFEVHAIRLYHPLLFLSVVIH